ncbi:MAG: hypothetical protein PHH22_02860 [Clostridia bacterium]|nr:hypothetical protein [Clostridia bacterium]
MKLYVAFDYCNIRCQDKIICNKLVESCDMLSEQYNYMNLTEELIALFERNKSRFIPKDTVDLTKMDQKIHIFMSLNSLNEYLNDKSFNIFTITSITVNSKIKDLYYLSLIFIPICQTGKGTTIWKIIFFIDNTNPINKK